MNDRSDLPSHYLAINPESNRFADIMARLRIVGAWDVNTSVALNRLTTRQPAWCLTREFVHELLDEAAAVSPVEHDEWLRETAHENWIYDGLSGETKFDEFLTTVRAEIYRPTYDKVFRSDSQAIYAIHGLPTVYLLYETTRVAGFEEPLVDSRHFVDLGSVVAPLALRSCGGAAAYIEA